MTAKTQMIQFKTLRLSGFKSFVEKTELEIGPGLNGIVGPNGCGKSNLVEALRWVMGENSAKRMRGAGMDDVIFAGTDKRSPRNFAEVSLLLDNSARAAPSQYNAADEVEVVRRIERDKGSDYRINGKLARARDVQMLFADTVTGSNSPALVSQGHVTRMINAKPQDRRLILEESAGIAGLYARRHEAEIRLKAADSNLVRVEDISGSMETRLGTLKRQSRQAAKYRNLNGQIRQLEITITYLEWKNLVEKKKDIHERFAKAESIVAEKLATVLQLTKTQNTQSEELPALRKRETELAAALQTKKIALQQLEGDALRHSKALQEAKDLLHQANIDRQHEEHSLGETGALLEKIQIEQAELQSHQSGEEENHKTLIAERDALKLKVMELEERFTALKENAAETRARQNALEKQIQSAQSRLDSLLGRKEKAQIDKQTIQLDDKSKAEIKQQEDFIEKLEQDRIALLSQTESARQKIQSAEDHTNSLRDTVAESQRAYTKFLAEVKMLESFFKGSEDKNFTPVLDSITTKAGFEKALSRALGDCLLASTDTNAPAYWLSQDKKSIPALPAGLQSLLPFVDAPEELHCALSQIGYVENDDNLPERAAELLPGQSIVSAQGTYCRWDGYVIKSSAADRHAVYLEQKNKLVELEAKRDEIENLAIASQKNLEASLAQHSSAKQDYSKLLEEIKGFEKKLSELRPALFRLKEKTAKNESEVARLEDVIKTADEDIKSVTLLLDNDKNALNILISNQNDDQESLIGDVQKKLGEERDVYQTAIRNLTLFEQQQSTRRARLQAISDERINLQNRSIRAKEHLKNIVERIDTLDKKLAELKSQPKNHEAEHEKLLNQISQANQDRDAAAQELAQCESEIALTVKALKESEAILGDAREERAHAQATLSAINEQLESSEKNTLESVGVAPKDLPNHAALDLVKYQIPDLDRLKSEKESLVREREAIGPVNLQAEDEARQLEQELTTMLHERNDLIQAIGELRGAIDKINKEARERLSIAFQHVNAHFQHLFLKLFGGGKAHLELIDSADPLGAGLEIFAQPPGKALQSLSLLSGGEQTLASIALIFAMFLTNPSPICVLDEIDAPLDDANVDRVCNLLDEIAARGETRFLIITHHRLSMARMDRLYGVTMSEKGVSQLVSVDIQQSFEFLDQNAA